jgi:malonyl-CoA/methylmalonyl-CoA synthetase
VIGVPHPDFGETVLGLIVPQPGEAPNLDAIAVAVSERLARFKQPRRLMLIEALPRNTMGKVQKNLLREEYATLFAPARG